MSSRTVFIAFFLLAGCAVAAPTVASRAAETPSADSAAPVADAWSDWACEDAGPTYCWATHDDDWIECNAGTCYFDVGGHSDSCTVADAKACQICEDAFHDCASG